MAATIAPNPPKLSTLPPTDFFTDKQWSILSALLDASLPSMAPKSAAKDRRAQVEVPKAEFNRALERLKRVRGGDVPSDEALWGLLGDKCAADPMFVDNCKRFICSFPAEHQDALGDALKKLSYVYSLNLCYRSYPILLLPLTLHSSRIGAYILTGYCTPYDTLPTHTRAKILESWRTSWIPQLRVLSKTIQQLAQKAYFQTNPTFKQLSGYPDVPQDYKPGPGYDFQFLQFPASSDNSQVEISADVVIVGSGPGGSVCARTLAEAGHSVLVVDKGYHFPPTQLPMPQTEACEYLFEGQGLLASADKSSSLVMGTCWGGSGTINWSVSLQTQDYVREEWAKKDGLPFFTSERFQKCLDRVCEAMGVSDEYIRHNHGNRVLLESSEKLGWKAKPAPQNTMGKEHYCGQCHLGCGSNEKMGPAACYLPAAARAGAKFIEGFEVEKVLFEEGEKKTKKAVGVVGTWVSRDKKGGVDGPAKEKITRRVVVKAKKVIVSSGSIWSPVILKKSGLEVCFYVILSPERAIESDTDVVSLEPPNRQESAHPSMQLPRCGVQGGSQAMGG